MNKIICDICGTSYLDTSESCPICGCSRDSAADFLTAEVLEEETADTAVDAAAEIEEKNAFDLNEFDVDSEDVIAEDEDDEEEDDDDDDDDDDEDDDDEEDDDDAPRSNTFVVILLTVLIIVLLGAAAFLYFRFFLPNRAQETTPATAAQQLDGVQASTEAVIPCDHIAMSSAGVAELNAEGQQFLVHVRVYPENTTDKVIYTVADESIATVTEDGKITAVSEGETVVYISCGIQSMECPVIVKYVEETVPPTTAAVAETTAETTVEPAAEEATEATEAPAPTAAPDVVLKLKKTDIQLGVYYQFQLQLDCNLKPEDVTWTSEHPHIATVDAQGNVTAVKNGTTSVTAKYGDQEVSCIVRCVWY